MSNYTERHKMCHSWKFSMMNNKDTQKFLLGKLINQKKRDTKDTCHSL